MADDSMGMDVSGLLAPWMAQNPWDASQYGGNGQMGASLLAAAGPTPYKQPFLVGLGKGMLAGQNQALANAKARMGMGMQSLALQRQMAMWPMLMSAMSQLSGQGGGSQPSDGSAPQDAGNASPAATAGVPASPGMPAPTSPQASPAPWMGGNAPASGGGGGLVGMDPIRESNLGAVFSLAGVPNELGKDAAFRAQYTPGMATAMEFAKSPIAMDMMMLNQAARAGNSQFSRMALTKLKTDMGTEHIGSMSGIRTYQEPDGSWTTVSPATGLKVNDRTGASYMPGALQAFAAREAAEKGAGARATLAAETSPGGTGGGGGASAVPAPAVAQAPAGARASAVAPAPQGQLTGLQAMTAQNYVPPVLAQAGRVPQNMGSTSLSALKELQEGSAKEANETVDEMQQRAAEGQTLIAQTDQIRAAASEYPWTGRFADDRANFLNLLQGAGWLTDKQTKELSAYQDATKIAVQLQASATKQLGSREAAQVFGAMGRSIPNLSMSPDGLDKVSAYMNGIARYNQSMAMYAQRLRDQGNANGVNEVENTFIAHSNPSFFILASASEKTRQEFLATMPQAKKVKFIQQWDDAIKNGLAPRPLDYQGQ